MLNDVTTLRKVIRIKIKVPNEKVFINLLLKI